MQNPVAGRIPKRGALYHYRVDVRRNMGAVPVYWQYEREDFDHPLEDLLTNVDRLVGSKGSRSAFIERVLRRYLRDHSRAAAHARDLTRINRAAQCLNAEAADVLTYQASIE